MGEVSVRLSDIGSPKRKSQQIMSTEQHLHEYMHKGLPQDYVNHWRFPMK